MVSIRSMDHGDIPVKHWLAGTVIRGKKIRRELEQSESTKNVIHVVTVCIRKLQPK